VKKIVHLYRVVIFDILIFFLIIAFTIPLYAAQGRNVKAKVAEVKEVKPTETAEDYYKMWLTSYDNGEYERSIAYMKKAVDLDPSYSTKIKEHVEKSEEELVAKIDIESKKKEVLAKESAKELEEKKKQLGEKEESAVKRRPLKFGPLTMNPYINYRLTWDDNIYLSDTDTAGDLISEFIPGLGAKLELPFGLPIISTRGTGVGVSLGEPERTLIDLEYIPDIKSYFDHSKENYVDHTFIGTSIIPSNLFGGRGKLVFGLKDIFRSTRDPATSESSKFRPRYSNEMEAKAKCIKLKRH